MKKRTEKIIDLLSGVFIILVGLAFFGLGFWGAYLVETEGEWEALILCVAFFIFGAILIMMGKSIAVDEYRELTERSFWH